jgi:ABC-2 type transport system permease protein
VSLLRSELRIRSRATWGWLAGIVLLVAMIAGFYPAVRNLASLDSIYAGLPTALQSLLGGSDLVSPSGYLRTQLLAFFLPVVLLILGMSRGAAALAGEEEDRTLDLLLAQPISRARLYLVKSAAITWWLGLSTLATFATLAALDTITGLNLPWGDLAAVCVQLGLMCLAAALITMAVASGTGRRVIGIATVGYYVFVAYLVQGLAEIVSWLRPVRPLSVWHWYLGDDPLSAGLDPTSVAVLVGVCVAAVAAGAWAFTRRDLHA